MPAIVTIPRDTPSRPVAGWPVVIFQHGITLNRTAVLTIADTLAAAGFATVAIDLPLHGFAPSNTDPLRALSPSSNAYVGPNFVNVRVAERTAGVDLVNNENEAPEPDGIVDASGTHFINLSNLITGRDNVREAVANLFFLREAIASIDGDRDGIVDGDFDNDGAADLDGANVSFIGHSLGAIVGVTYTAFDDSLISAVLSNPGQGIAKVLVSSPTFGPTVLRGLEAAGLKPGEPNFAAFLTAAQTVLDGADPAAFARSAALRRLPILVFEAVGGGDVPSDQVIPNQIDGAPLAGTDPLIALLGPTGIGPGDALNDARGLRLVVRMSRGGHVGLIDRSDDLAVTNEMQRMVATFLASQGTALDVIDETVVSAP
jgi:pimeloyl-ACP methyl ester carboxylesterase